MKYDKLIGLKALICDVDGVLTDGSIPVTTSGELKVFNVRDGLGMKLAMNAGYKLAFLSGRSSAVLEQRAAELGIDMLKTGRLDKQTALKEISEAWNMSVSEMAYIGDDIIDLAPIQMCKASFCPRDAVEEVQAVADFILPVAGGKGAVRAALEMILKANHQWADCVRRFEVKHA